MSSTVRLAWATSVLGGWVAIAVGNELSLLLFVLAMIAALTLGLGENIFGGRE